MSNGAGGVEGEIVIIVIIRAHIEVVSVANKLTAKVTTCKAYYYSIVWGNAGVFAS